MVDAIRMYSERLRLGDGVFAEIVVWRVPEPVRGSSHHFKYRLALIAEEVCVLRFDNEAGKGDHKHVGDRELAYDFVGVDALRRDFLLAARAWLEGNPGH